MKKNVAGNKERFRSIILPLVPNSDLAWQYIGDQVFIIDDYNKFVVCLENVNCTPCQGHFEFV